MNDNLVAIKVDREERPDVDAVYMTATQAMTGQGGWPMTVFLTPDREPFFCGTYFPRDYFQRLVAGVTKAWQEDKGDVTRQASEIAAALAERATPLRGAGDAPGQAALAELTDQAVRTLARDYDAAQGGFGDAPKFPPSMVLEFLLRNYERGGPGGAQALAMTEGTAEAMARGGVYDQLAGGFARYSTDAAWVVPHFEKMLYDNALLARVYAHLWRRTGSALARRVAAETCQWMLSELGTPEGGLAAALDADSDGAEGLFYTWTPAELTDALGADDGEWAALAFRVTGLARSSTGARCCSGAPTPAIAQRFAPGARRAAGRRADSGSGRAGTTRWWRRGTGWPSPRWPRPGCCSASRSSWPPRRAWPRCWTGCTWPAGGWPGPRATGWPGRAPGVLDDYACVADGFLALAGVTGEARWVTLAGQLLDTALDRFGDGSGGFYDTADDGETLVFRPADPADGPTPSGAFAAAGALLSYAALTGSQRHREAAVAALGVLGPIAERYPRAAGWGLAVAEALLSGPGRDRRGRAARRRRHRGAAPDRAARGAARRGHRARRRVRGGRHRAAGRARAGRRRAGRLRLPRLHLPGPGHRAGRAARRAGSRRQVNFPPYFHPLPVADPR